MKKSTSILALVLCVLLLLGTIPAMAEEEPVTLGFISLNLNHPFFVAMMEASAEADEDFNCKSIWKSCESNIDTEIALVDGFVEQGVDCIILSPVDAEAIIPAVERAIDAGIPVVTMSNVINEERSVATTFELERAGRHQAQLMGTLMGGEGKFAYMVGLPGNDTSDTMQRGFEAGMKEFWPEIEYQILISNYDAPTALQEVEKCLAATEDLKALGSCTDDALVAASEAFKDKDLFIIGMDGVDEAVAHIAANEWNSSIVVGARRLGYWNTKIGAELARGADFPHITKMPMGWLLSEDTMKVVEENNLLEGEVIYKAADIEALLNGYRTEFGPGTKCEDFFQ